MIILLVALFIVFISIWLWFDNSKIKGFSLAGLLTLAIYWRISSWQYPLSLCIDEAEWLALASRLKDCTIPFQCYNGSTTGFLSIGLLNVMPTLGLDLSYFNLRIFGFILCIIPAAILCYYGIRKWYGASVAKQVFPWLSMFMIFGFYNREFLTYNTEYLLMVFYAAVFYLFATWKQNNFGSKWEPIGMALLLGIMPYVKLQSVPFVFAWYGILLWMGWRNKTWSRLLVWHAALALATLVFAGYFLYRNIFMDFYRMYIESNAYYVNHRITSYKYSDNEFIHRLRAFKGMHITTFMPLYLGLLPLILWGLRKKTTRQNSYNQICWPCLWIFICVCYSTYTTGNGYGHYNVLLIVPVMFLLGNVYHIFNAEGMKIQNALTVIGLVIPMTIYARRAEIFKYDTTFSLTETEKYIINTTGSGEKVLYMGWVEALEAQVRTQRRLPVRNATYQYIGIGDSSLRGYYQKGFFHDMQENKPRYVLDMENVMEMPGLKPVKAFILQHYILDTILEDNLIYKLKNNHTDVSIK
ncbi:MAG: hypothetical protein ACK5CL_08765 [Sphingomonadales bacterium]|jgi:hypothetical protein